MLGDAEDLELAIIARSLSCQRLGINLLSSAYCIQDVAWVDPFAH